jgi:hypothetical protein
MKRIALLSAIIIPLLVIAGFIVVNNGKAKEPVITFYQTPLVCNAAPEIGCGSRAKPALLELEKNPAVKEAWLNRTGTVIAIVWKDKANTDNVTKPVLDANNISFTELKDKELASHQKTFRQEKLWYRGADVDKLSLEEASTIAQTTIKPALESKLITAAEGEKIRAEIEAYFKKELVMLRTNEQLNEDSENKWKLAMIEIAEKHIGKERTEKAMELYLEICEKQCKKDGSCTQPGTKKDCCDHK